MKQRTRIKHFQFTIIISLFCMFISSCEVSEDVENTQGLTLNTQEANLGTQAVNLNTPEINFWYGDEQWYGVIGNSQNWINIVGNISQAGVTNIKSLIKGNYSLNEGKEKPFTIGKNGNRLVNEGDFNIGIDYHEFTTGRNVVKVTLSQKDNDVELVSKDVIVNYTSGKTWPFPYTANWGLLTLTDILNVTEIEDQENNNVAQIFDGQIVDGFWQLESGVIRVVPGLGGYDLTIAIGDETWPTDYEVTVPFTMHSDTYRGVGFAFGWQGHTGSENPPKQWPLQALAWVRAGNELEIVTYDGPKTETGGWEKSEVKANLSHKLGENEKEYFIKARSKSIPNSNLSRVHVKFWAVTENEPDTWLISADVPTRKGSVLLVAYDVELSFGKVTIDALDGVHPPDIAPPIIRNISSVTSDTTAVISWDSSEAADSKIDYGFNTNYQSSVSDAVLVLKHEITISDLVPNSQYNFQVTSVDHTGKATSSENLFFNTTNNGSGPSGLVPDDFGDVLNTDVWEVYDPIAVSVFSMTSTQFEMSLPEGTTHNLWKNALDAPRIRQNVIDTDFHVEVKFDSPVLAQYQLQGITVEQDNNNLLRFDFFSDGSKTYLFYASFVNGIPTVSKETEIEIGVSSYLRVERSGDQWLIRYSVDGLNWINAGSYTHNITARKVGVFAGNVNNGSSPAPQHTVLVDHFHIIDSDEVVDPDDPVEPGNAISDEFDNGFDGTVWNTYAPLADGSVTAFGSQLHLYVPEGARHDLWTNNLNAPRITQQISNTDFEIEAKFDSTVTEKYQMQGIIVEEDHNNLLRFEFHSDGSTTNVFAASIVNGQAKQELKQSITTVSSPIFLKVTRTGDQWTTSYSDDGLDWNVVGRFNHTITTNTAGLFVGNSGNSAPEYTAVIDYFKFTNQ